MAEGIESPEQLAQLRELGCDVGQGFLLGRPSAPDVLAMERDLQGRAMTVVGNLGTAT